MGNQSIQSPNKCNGSLNDKNEYKIMVEGSNGVGKSTFTVHYTQNFIIEE